MEGKKGFVLYIDTYDAIKDLSIEEKAQLLDAIFQYHINPENPVGSLGSGAKVAFNFLLAQFKRDFIKYEKRAERSRVNGSKGGRPKTQRVISKPRKPDSDSESDREINNSSASGELSVNDSENLQLIEGITQQDISEIAQLHSISEENVRRVLHDLKNYALDGKFTYIIKDARRKLEEWTDRQITSGKIKPMKSLEEFLEEETGNPVT